MPITYNRKPGRADGPWRRVGGLNGTSRQAFNNGKSTVKNTTCATAKTQPPEENTPSTRDSMEHSSQISQIMAQFSLPQFPIPQYHNFQIPQFPMPYVPLNMSQWPPLEQFTSPKVITNPFDIDSRIVLERTGI